MLIYLILSYPSACQSYLLPAMLPASFPSNYPISAAIPRAPSITHIFTAHQVKHLAMSGDGLLKQGRLVDRPVLQLIPAQHRAAGRHQ